MSRPEHVRDEDPPDQPAAVVRPTFEQLYADERRSLLALAIALTGRTDVAEELVQEAFLRAHRNWNRVAALERPGAWLRRVLLNLVTSRGRRLLVEARGLTRIGTEREREHGRPGDAMVDDSLEFWRVVRSLPRRQAQVVALYYGVDLPTAVIAETLGIAEGTVRAQLNHARRSLADRLGRQREDEP